MMTDTPLRRAALALMQSRGGAGEFDALDDKAMASLIQDVRAVLEALREPSKLMVEAGAEIVKNVHVEESDEAFASDAVNTWRYMIDAALSE